MNEKGHVINALGLGVGLGVLLEPSLTVATLRSVLKAGVPVLLGALFPDIDTTFGTHRKTLHNLPVLLLFAAFPVYFGNLFFVWLGILTHYVLDLLGNVKGMAVFYPHGELYDVPVGVSVTSTWADVVTLLVTAFELAVAAAIVHYGYRGILGTPSLSGLLAALPA